jgi:hypothetical protein
VTVPAVDADATDVVLVAELHGLLDELVGGGDEVGSLDGEDRPSQAGQDEQAGDDAAPRPVIGALREYLHVPYTLLAQENRSTLPRFAVRELIVKIFASRVVSQRTRGVQGTALDAGTYISGHLAGTGQPVSPRLNHM